MVAFWTLWVQVAGNALAIEKRPTTFIHAMMSSVRWLKMGLPLMKPLLLEPSWFLKNVQRINGRDNFGTIAPGKRADLILLEQNPLDDVAHVRKVRGVMAIGRWYDQKAIAQMMHSQIISKN